MPLAGDTAESYFGSCHLMELPFVFDELCLPTLHGPDALLGTEPPPDSLAARVHAAWAPIRDLRRPRLACLPPSAPTVE